MQGAPAVGKLLIPKTKAIVHDFYAGVAVDVSAYPYAGLAEADVPCCHDMHINCGKQRARIPAHSPKPLT